MRLQLALMNLAGSIGDAGSFLAYLARHVAYTLAWAAVRDHGLGLVLTTAGTALLWIVAATGGVTTTPSTSAGRSSRPPTAERSTAMRSLFRRLRHPFAPVLDVDAMAADIAERTGIDRHTVDLVLEAEEDYLIRLGIADPPPPTERS